MNVDLISLDNVNEPDKVSADLLIIGATGEPRSWYFLQQIGPRCSSRWYLCESSVRRSISETCSSINSRDPQAVHVELQVLDAQLANLLQQTDGQPVVAVDVSCMSRTVMAEVFRALFLLAESRSIKVVVLYSIAEYTAPPASLPANEDIRPVNATFAGWPTNSAATTSLIVGLGYEKDKAEGACEYFDPSEVWVFVPRSPLPEFDEAVLSNNQELLGRETRMSRDLAYCVDDPEKTFGSLVTTVTSLISRSNPLILPFGPKIFFAISLLVAMLYEEVGVWLVTGDLAGAENDLSASTFSVAFEVELAPRSMKC